MQREPRSSRRAIATDLAFLPEHLDNELRQVQDQGTLDQLQVPVNIETDQTIDKGFPISFVLDHTFNLVTVTKCKSRYIDATTSRNGRGHVQETCFLLARGENDFVEGVIVAPVPFRNDRFRTWTSATGFDSPRGCIARVIQAEKSADAWARPQKRRKLSLVVNGAGNGRQSTDEIQESGRKDFPKAVAANANDTGRQRIGSFMGADDAGPLSSRSQEHESHEGNEKSLLRDTTLPKDRLSRGRAEAYEQGSSRAGNLEQNQTGEDTNPEMPEESSSPVFDEISPYFASQPQPPETLGKKKRDMARHNSEPTIQLQQDIANQRPASAQYQGQSCRQRFA